MPAIPSPFKGSVRESPFPGAVREGSWKEPGGPPQPPRLPELAQTPGPQGTVPAQVISPADIARHESEVALDPEVEKEDAKEEATNRIMTQHSMTLDPNDRRVTLRVNPDTGSIRTTGGYFVPGDVAHERLLEHTSDYDRDKIPAVSSAIARGDPFSFLYRSAEEEEPEGEEGRPTGESRAYEQAISTAEQRAESAEGQLQRVTMIPQQWAITKPSVEKPRRVMLEGFASDAALNNAQHTLNAATEAGVPVPYQDTGFKFQKDLAGYLMNQQHGYLGDGTGPRLDANNVPNKAYLAEQAKPPGERYVPHLLKPEEAEFMNTAMNIVPSGTARPEGKRPTFSQNAQWLSRVNQGNIGREAGPNKLREQLDRMMPEVGMRNKKGKVTRHVPWSKGVLEPTYRAYRLDLLEHTHPHPTAPQSIRAREGVPHEPHIVMKAPVAVHTAGEYKPPQAYAGGGLVMPAPISRNPEVGAPTGEGTPAHIDPTRVRAAYKTDKIRWIPTHELENRWKGGLNSQDVYIGRGGSGKNAIGERYPKAVKHLAGTEPVNAPRVSFWDDGSAHFTDGRHTYAAMRDAGHTHVPVAIHQDDVADAESAGVPLSDNPEMGAPVGEGQEESPSNIIHIMPPRRYEEPTLLPKHPEARRLTAPITWKKKPTGEEPELHFQEGGEVPESQPQGMEFASPSIREDMTYNAAKLALNKDQQQRMLDYSNRLEERLGQHFGVTPASVTSGIGQWTDGAEPTTISTYENQPEEARRISLAARGLHGGQKQVLSFRPHAEGPHDYYRLTFNTDKPEDVGELLDKHGIQFRTFAPRQKGLPVTVHVVDTERALPDAIENLIKSGDVIDAHSWPGHAEFLGDQNGTDREEAANEYRRTLGEAAENWRKGSHPARGGSERGGVSEPPAQPPWQDLVDEAEENFQKLRESDLYQEQQLAHDYARSKADRDNIPPEHAAVRDQYFHTAIPWAARNPELDSNSMYSYMLGRTHFPSDKMTKAQIAEHVEKTHRKLDIINNPEHKEQVADMFFRDMMHSLAGSFRGTPNDAYGWYDRSVSKTIDHVAQIAPEIKTDPRLNLAFRLSLAITSQGQKVPDNLTSTWHAYQYFKTHGRFPTDNAFVGAGGKEIKQIMNNFEKMNNLLHGENNFEKLGHEKLDQVLNEKITKGDLKKKYGLDVAGEKVGTTVRGAMGLGPKIGAFFSNLSGHFDPITMDRWFARQMNFYTGDMFNFSEDALKKGTTDFRPQIDELREFLQTPEAIGAVGKGQARTMNTELNKLARAKNLTRSKAMELAPTVYDWAKEREKAYMKSYGETEGPQKGSYHADFGTPENRLAKRIHENVNELADAPRNSAERDAWRDIVGRVHEKLMEHGINLTNSDKQALPWFDIKDLFRLAGSNTLRNVDYLDAAYTLVRKVKQGLLPDLMKEAENG